MNTNLGGMEIIGFPNYLIFDSGIIISKRTGKQLCVGKHRNGYAMASLYNNGYRKNCTIHRLVAIHFIPNLENKPQVNHINGIKTDNSVENLEWCTEKENSRHSFDTGLMENSKRSAAKRMSEIGKRYATINGNNLRELNKLISKPVIQLTKDGEFIKRWDSIKQAEKETRSFGIRNVLQSKAKQSGGFKWIYA